MKPLPDLLKDLDPDEDAFILAQRVTPDELRRVADDWERMAPSIAEEFRQKRKREGEALRRQFETAAELGDEKKLWELHKETARNLLGIVTRREINIEIARQLGSIDGYSDAMRCALDLMI